MAKGKKYDYRVAEDQTGWAAEIIRQVTSKETVVSESQNGFATEAEAQAWAQKELQQFIGKLSERSKIRSDKHEDGRRYRK